MVDTSDEWIRTRTGIEERRIAEDDMDTSDLAYEAAKEAIKNAGISPEQIGLNFSCDCDTGSSVSNCCIYATRQLGATNAAAMDITAACAGFMYG